MPERNRPLSESQIAALKRLKVAYTDAGDAGGVPRQFAVRANDLLRDGVTTADLLSLVEMRYVEHVQEVTRNGESRRQFRAAETSSLGPNSCFFLSYGGNVYIEHGGREGHATLTPTTSGATKAKAKQADELVRSRSKSRPREELGSTDSRVFLPGGRETPVWNAAEGNLYWCGQVVLHLAVQASAEREILDEFEKWHWKSPIQNPIPRETTGDPTQSRRHAVYNLNRRLGDKRPIEFSNLQRGLMAWRACV